MSGDTIALIAALGAATITAIAALASRLITPRVQHNATVVNSALELVREHRAEYHQNRATIESLWDHITRLEAENQRLRDRLP